MSTNVEQLRRVLYAVPGALAELVPVMDCTTGNKSTFTGGQIGALGCTRSGGAMEFNSVVAVLINVGDESFAFVFCNGHTISSTTASPRLRLQAGGEGVGGRAAVGAYNALRRTEFIHIALGLIVWPLVKPAAEQTPQPIGLRCPKKERGPA